MIRSLLAMADAMDVGIITWREEPGHGWFCFASNAKVPHVARGGTGIRALAELIAFLRRVA